MHHVAERQERSIEWQIQDRYCQLRKKTHPFYRPSAASDREWLKTADVVKQIGADPRLYIEAQFELYPGSFPYPNQLYQTAAQERYRRYMEEYEPESSAIHAQQGAYLHAYLNNFEGTEVDEILCNPSSNFRPYFRIIICSDHAVAAISKIYGAAAFEELTKNTDLLLFLEKEKNYADRIKEYIVQSRVSGRPCGTPLTVPPPSAPPSGRQGIVKRL